MPWPKPFFALLDEYEVIFQKPHGLSPPRAHEHKIMLKDETKVIKNKPYRYPYVQKLEIEKLVQELLSKGVFCDNYSPFSSLVFLVRKKDGS